jgi:hypothetical protein
VRISSSRYSDSHDRIDIERLTVAGDLPLWLLLILASACLIVAVARPRGPSTLLGRAGVDIACGVGHPC